MLSVVVDDQARAELTTDLDELFRQGARRMLAAALEAEVDAYLAAHAELVDEHGHRLVRRNGHAPVRTLATGVGQVEVVRPRVDDRRTDPATGQRQQFQSLILPRWCRRSPKVAEVLPLLYLHGLSSLDFVPALERFLGSSAGLSASVVTRLTVQWQAERQAFLARDLSERDYVYCWADGIHFNLRLEDGRLCCLVLVGVRADGTKELVAVADGQRESGDAWAELLRDCRRRGMRAPVVMVGDGALGLWAGLREVFPETREQRCWVHKVANVLNTLPKSVHAGARRALNEIAQAEDRAHAERAIEALVSDYGAKWPKAVAKVVDDQEALLTFFDYPAEHWLHLRTTNPIWVFSLARRIARPERDLAGHRWLRPDSEFDWSSARMPSNSRCRARLPGTRRRAAWLEGSWALNPDLPARGLLVSRPAPALQTTGGWRAATRRSGGDRRAQAGV